MLSIDKIVSQYPQNLQPYREFILKEYLQYKILESIFSSEFAVGLSFIGGTALRIIYGNNRFSEDLDFDNFGLKENEFVEVSKVVKKMLEREGYLVEIKNVFKGAFRCKIKIPKLLFDSELSALLEQKIFIQIDTTKQQFDYKPDTKILNKFDVFTQINITPIDILLSQKIYAVFGRKRAKGRDFYDIVFLLSQTSPNYDYLKLKIGIGSPKALKRKFLEKNKELDFEKLAKDVQPFLFNPSDAKKVRLFPSYIEEYFSAII